MSTTTLTGTATMIRVLLDTTRPQDRRLLSDTQRLHAKINAAFDTAIGASGPPVDQDEKDRRRDARGPVLWRVERAAEHQVRLLIVANLAVAPQEVAGALGVPVDAVAVRDYDQVLSRLQSGTTLLLRVKVNATTDISGPGRRSQRREMRGQQVLDEWAPQRLAAHGLTRVPGTGRVVADGVERFVRNGVTQTVAWTTIEQRVTITDPAAARELLLAGLGRRKAYGYGLVTLTR